MRWYDKSKELRKYIESLKDMDKKKRDNILKDILVMIREDAPGLITSDSAIDFPLELNRRRWYDSDPYLWLIINGLKEAEDEFLQRVIKYLKENV